jgi:hypothetical protein
LVRHAIADRLNDAPAFVLELVTPAAIVIAGVTSAVIAR